MTEKFINNNLLRIPSFSRGWLIEFLPWEKVLTNYYKIAQIKLVNNKILEKLSNSKNVNMFEVIDSYFLSDVLKSVPLFKDLSEEIIKKLLAGIYYKEVNAGDIIVKQNDPAKTFYIINNGCFDVTIRGVDGKDLLIRSLTGGDYFGEIALLYDVPRQATITAATPGGLMVLNKETFEKVIENSGVKDDLIEILNKRKKELTEIYNDDLIDYKQSLYIDNQIEIPLIIIEDIFIANDNNDDKLLNQQLLEIKIESLKQEAEWELINNKDFGLLNNIAKNLILANNKNLQLLDRLDELISLIYKPSFFLANPKDIIKIERECNNHNLSMQTVALHGINFMSWRGVPIIPSKALQGNIVILRTGIPDYGIVGICKDTSNDYNVPGLLIEHIENNKYNIKLFLSISVLSNDSIAMLNLQ